MVWAWVSAWESVGGPVIFVCIGGGINWESIGLDLLTTRIVMTKLRKLTFRWSNLNSRLTIVTKNVTTPKKKSAAK